MIKETATRPLVLGVALIGSLLLGTGAAVAGDFMLPKELVEAAQHADTRSDSNPLNGLPDLQPKPNKPKLIFPEELVKNAQDKPMLDPTLIDFAPGGGAKLGAPDGEQGVLRLACSFGPDGLLIRNVGDLDAPAGLKLKWQARELRLDGVVRLSKALRSGQAASLQGVSATGDTCGIKLAS